MKKFKITKDTKCTITYREEFEVKANSLKEAKQKIERENIQADYGEYLYLTGESISHQENYAMAAAEHLLAGTGLMETDAEGYESIKYPEKLNYEIK